MADQRAESQVVLSRVVGIVGLLPLVVACQAVDTGAGWVNARIQGPIDMTPAEIMYEGTGAFDIGGWDPATRVSQRFSLHSVGTDSSDGQELMFVRLGTARPGEGRYELASPTWQDGRLEGFTVNYYRITDGRKESYTTRSGELEITASSGDRIEGSFRFTAVLYCSTSYPFGPAEDDWCPGAEHPYTVIPGAPEIEVTGSFLAVPFTSPGVESPNR